MHTIRWINCSKACGNCSWIKAKLFDSKQREPPFAKHNMWFGDCEWNRGVVISAPYMPNTKQSSQRHGRSGPNLFYPVNPPTRRLTLWLLQPVTQLIIVARTWEVLFFVCMSAVNLIIIKMKCLWPIAQFLLDLQFCRGQKPNVHAFSVLYPSSQHCLFPTLFFNFYYFTILL